MSATGEAMITIQERLKKLFVANFEFDEAALTPEATMDGLGLDSLDKIEFMFAIEEEFGIKMPDRDVKIVTIQDMIDIINRLVSEKQA